MANRDPSVFEQPNEIVLDRKGNRHFSFGIGVHRCVGSIALPQLLCIARPVSSLSFS